ncbi:MAG: HD domain-containing protein [Cellulosilyticaceae bacterium]
MSYRVRQFMWAMTARITTEEERFVEQHLTPKEAELFWKLKVYEQKHSIKVAKALGEEIKTPQVRQEWIRLGLLHDIGKLVYPIGPIRKSMMVLLHKYTKGKVQKLTLPMVKCYYDHPKLGYELLQKEEGYEESFLKLIKNHHQTMGSRSQEPMKSLQKWDDAY